MRRAYKSGKSGNWENFKEEFRKKRGKVCEGSFERLQETYDKVAMEDIGRFSIAQEKSKKQHRLLEEDHRADVGYGRRDLVLCLPSL